MTSPVSDAKYIVYKYYDVVKSEFDRSENFTYDQNEFEKIFNNINLKRMELQLPKEFFIRLHKRLKNSNVFYDSHKKIFFCIFVNFWLNEEVRKSYNLVNATEFNIFDKYIVSFNDEVYGKLDNTCFGYMKYLKDDVYKRMEILNDLYEKYSQIKPHKGSADDNLCGTLNLMRQHYENATDKHKGDENFFNKLKELKLLIEQNEWASNNQCPVKNYIKLPEQNPAQLIEHSKAANQPKALSPELVSPGVSRSQNLSNSDSGLQVLSRKQDNAQKDHMLGSTFTGGSRGNSDALKENISKYSSEQRRERGSQINSEYSPLLEAPVPTRQVQNMETGISWNTEGFGRYKTMDTQEDSKTVLDPNTHAITQEGLMGKIQGAFSSISEYVEPVPLMGVSGGMGALFLLLRYTPVGAFFRGGRGRAHRIPRSFNGQFLGGFPGYEEYDVGHIGYGPMSMNPLAE